MSPGNQKKDPSHLLNNHRFILAIADLIGVSFDVVNFLNSAIGCKVASFGTIIIASAGVLFAIRKKEPGVMK